MDADLRAFLQEQRRAYLTLADGIAKFLGLRLRGTCPLCGAPLE